MKIKQNNLYLSNLIKMLKQMPHKSQILLDITKVAGAAGGAAVIKLADINTVLTTISICLAIGYTAYKWIKESKKK